MFIQTLSSHCKFDASQNWEPAGRIGDFGNFFKSFDKNSHVLRSSWILNECNLYCKIVKYRILSEVCMIKTVPHSTVSPQMWCTKSIKRLVYTPPDLLARFCNVKTCRTPKIRPDFFFPRICFPGLIYCDQQPLWLLNVIEDDCYFLVVHIRLSTRCKTWLTSLLDCLQIIFL